jgi:hypothetical protein
MPLPPPTDPQRDDRLAAQARVDRSDVTPGEQEPDGEPGELIREELERLVHHPREEITRLRSVERDGESGATPIIAIAGVATLVVPLVALVIAVALAIYYLAG